MEKVKEVHLKKSIFRKGIFVPVYITESGKTIEAVEGHGVGGDLSYELREKTECPECRGFGCYQYPMDRRMGLYPCNRCGESGYITE